MENPRHGREVYLPWRPESIRVLPVSQKAYDLSGVNLIDTKQ